MLEPTEDFASLLARARRGEHAALTELIRQYEPDLRMAARVRLGRDLRPYLDSMDVVQSVHGSLIGGLCAGRFEITNPEQLLALAVTILRNKIAHQWRRIQRQLRLDQSQEEFLLSLVDPGEDPAHTAQLRDQIEFVYGKLDDTDRRLLELRQRGCTTAEAARAMKVDNAMLRMRLKRLRKRFMKLGIHPEFL